MNEKEHPETPELTKEEELAIEIHWIKEKLGIEKEGDEFYLEDKND